MGSQIINSPSFTDLALISYLPLYFVCFPNLPKELTLTCRVVQYDEVHVSIIVALTQVVSGRFSFERRLIVEGTCKERLCLRYSISVAI